MPTRLPGGAAGSKPHAVTGVTTKNASGVTTGTSAFAYDSTGNMTGRTLAGQSAQTLAWDAEGELISVAQDGNGDGDTADAREADKYLYSADGERLVRSQDGASTLYLPGGMELTAYDDGRASTANRYYTFAGKTITMRAAIGATGQTAVIPDHHGTPMLQVSQSTNVVTREYTDPFGATRGSLVGDADADGRLDGTSPVWVGDHGYLDKSEDTSGLTAIGARMYDPVLGRFISVDPVMDLSDPQQWNAYAYSNGNPVTLSDPTGLKPIGGNGGAEENKWANSVSKRMNRDARQRSRTHAAPPPCVSYCGGDLQAGGDGALLAGAMAMPTAPGTAAVSVAQEVKRQALKLRSGKTHKIRSIGQSTMSTLCDSEDWREFAAGGRTAGARALGPIGTVIGAGVSVSPRV